MQKKARRPSPRSAHPSTGASERVSEAAPGLPDSQAFATRERAETDEPLLNLRRARKQFDGLVAVNDLSFEILPDCETR